MGSEVPKIIQGSTARLVVDTTYARKVYPLDANEQYYQRECDVYQRLERHPNIAELQRIEGRTLHLEVGECLVDVIQHTSVSTDQMAVWVQQLGWGLLYMHSKGVIHSDLRTAYAIISKQGCAKWIDFGASGIDDQPALDSYDVYSYKPRDPSLPLTSIETDIFAFGCTVFSMERGTSPYFIETRGMSTDATMTFVEEKFRQNEFPSTAGLRFAKLINSCWNGDYRSMEDVLTDLNMEDARQRNARSSSAVALTSVFAAFILWVAWRKRSYFTG